MLTLEAIYLSYTDTSFEDIPYLIQIQELILRYLMDNC